MSALWEWVPELNWSHDVGRRHCVPQDSDTYGAVIEQDLRPPVVTMTFRGRGLVANDLSLLWEALEDRGAAYSLTDKFGTSHSGTVLSVASPTINGALNPIANTSADYGMYDVVITMRMP